MAIDKKVKKEFNKILSNENTKNYTKLILLFLFFFMIAYFPKIPIPFTEYYFYLFPNWAQYFLRTILWGFLFFFTEYLLIKMYIKVFHYLKIGLNYMVDFYFNHENYLKKIEKRLFLFFNRLRH